MECKCKIGILRTFAPPPGKRPERPQPAQSGGNSQLLLLLFSFFGVSDYHQTDSFHCKPAGFLLGHFLAARAKGRRNLGVLKQQRHRLEEPGFTQPSAFTCPSLSLQPPVPPLSFTILRLGGVRVRVCPFPSDSDCCLPVRRALRP